jgi:hypothetical protein
MHQSMKEIPSLIKNLKTLSNNQEADSVEQLISAQKSIDIDPAF